MRYPSIFFIRLLLDYSSVSWSVDTPGIVWVLNLEVDHRIKFESNAELFMKLRRFRSHCYIYRSTSLMCYANTLKEPHTSRLFLTGFGTNLWRTIRLLFRRNIERNIGTATEHRSALMTRNGLVVLLQEMAQSQPQTRACHSFVSLSLKFRGPKWLDELECDLLNNASIWTFSQDRFFWMSNILLNQTNQLISLKPSACSLRSII